MPIDKKIIEVMRAVRGVARDSRNQHDRYDYASHEAVTSALRDHFAAHGIVRSVNMVGLDVLPGDAIHVTVDVSYTDSEDDTHVTCRMHALQPARKAGRTPTRARRPREPPRRRSCERAPRSCSS